MVKKWTASEKSRIVLESLTTSISTAETCRKHNLSPNTFYPWKKRFLESGKMAFSGDLMETSASRSKRKMTH